MQHKCKVTVLECKCFCDYQEKYLADPKSGPCPMYHVGDEFIFERYGDKDIDDQLLIDALQPLADNYKVTGID